MPDETEIAKRRLAYDEYRNKQIQKDQNKVEESKKHVDKVYEVSQNNYKKNANLLESHGVLKWILKYPNVTIKNLMPFSPTRDINNAPFEMPNDELRSKRVYQPFDSEESRLFVVSPQPNRSDVIYSSKKSGVKRPKACRLEAETPLNKQIKATKEDPNHIYFAKLIERPSHFYTKLAKGESAWRSIAGFIGPALKSEKEMQLRKKLDSDLSICKERREQLAKHFNAEPDTFNRFAERMRQNTLDFENFCANRREI